MTANREDSSKAGAGLMECLGDAPPLIQELAKLAALFAETLASLNEVAARQREGVLELAFEAVKGARPMPSAEAATAHGTSPATADQLLAGIQNASAASTSLAENARAAVVNAPNAPSGVVDLSQLAFANTVESLNLAMSNAVSNQQATNQTALSALAQCVTLVLSSAKDCGTGDKQ